MKLVVLADMQTIHQVCLGHSLQGHSGRPEPKGSADIQSISLETY